MRVVGVLLGLVMAIGLAADAYAESFLGSLPDIKGLDASSLGGDFFITELLKQPDPGGAYGPYAFGTSAYSDVLMHFGNGGDGQIGIHGTDQPSLIPGVISHGCIRMPNADILRLAAVMPVGTPITVR